jgi:hypothetical protein
MAERGEENVPGKLCTSPLDQDYSKKKVGELV